MLNIFGVIENDIYLKIVRYIATLPITCYPADRYDYCTLYLKLARLPGNIQLVQWWSDRFGSQRHGPSNVQQRVADDHVPGGDVRGAGPLGHAFPPDQPSAVTSVSPPQHSHRVQPVLLTVSATAGHCDSDLAVVVILSRRHPVNRK